ncbi:hypothetical protein GOL30_33135 [Sinorhizobium medicae]|uniref:Uncharacterized protein n=1 Tax=Sinorhizobium medicae (strain WSM419) TaxID=366394 RepID=A6UMX3_SINMW|nr:hypothetical protein [Sinorhizobium medicae]ABR65003.1 hypothetical protein Smed_6428 [Sinorhizobium medicae WSM419]MDX0537418.1 hypothetical protein [Sinorhizobium medicae]MDX1079350.1 hypothetical protein [Sinorhizobium medicae]MDX1134946.1 hypothetical protein [Sinorhizobium medicae]MDX1189270.1 hypothetical protein [Sinorhizobium medicae]
MADQQRKIVINLPRAPRPDETVGLNIITGPLPLGAEIRFRTAAGHLIGSAVPFGRTDPDKQLVFQLSLSGRDIDGSRLEIFADMLDAGGSLPRAPTEQELVSVTGWIVQQ